MNETEQSVNPQLKINESLQKEKRMNELLSWLLHSFDLLVSHIASTYLFLLSPEPILNSSIRNRKSVKPKARESLPRSPPLLTVGRAAPLLISQFHFLCIAFPSGTVNEEKKELRLNNSLRSLYSIYAALSYFLHSLLHLSLISLFHSG